MFDLSHQFGSDLAIAPTGDLATVSGHDLGQQRVLRRLLTNPGGYIWNLDYGAGLAGFIGEPGNALRIRAVIRSQIFKEPAVSRTPEPTIDVQLAPNGSAASVYASVLYVDSGTGQTQTASLSLGG